MPRFDALHQIMVLGFGHGVDKVNTSLVKCQNISRRKNPYIGRNHRSSVHTLAVTGYRHVAHNVDIGNMGSKIVDHSFGGFGHPLHKFLLADVPLIVLIGCGMNPSLAYAPVSTPDADILVASAKPSLAVPFEVSKHNKGIVAGKVAADRHLVKPLAAMYGQGQGILFVHDIHWAKSPSVHFQRFAMLLCGITVAYIVSIGFHYLRIRQVFLQQFLHPRRGNDVGAVLLARMQLHPHLAFDAGIYPFVSLNKPLGTKFACEVDYRLLTCPFFVGHIFIAVFPRHRLRRSGLFRLFLSATRSQQAAQSQHAYRLNECKSSHKLLYFNRFAKVMHPVGIQ